jgi:cytochrome c peroxidase
VQAVLNDDTQAMESILTPDEVAGLRLFIGPANCLNCHSGPLFTNNDFHNTGVPAAVGLPEDTGRALGAPQAWADEFNCLSEYSDAAPDQCT